MRILSPSVLWTQVVLFVLGTAYVLWAFSLVVAAGAGFVPGFESIQLRRLVAYFAPYLVLPVSFIVSLFLHIRRKYGTATWNAGQIYLVVVPDPIIDSLGARPAPSFFLRKGYQKTAHHYTKQEPEEATT
jgi:hypothetical protein